jgi:NADPH:quinone reductase-like Zn-dependent oxidoreductase
MKACVIQKHGGLECVSLQTVPKPEPAAGEAVVRVHAASLNHLDVWVRKGGRFNLPMPHVLGSDAAGVVEALGPDVHSPQVGDEVVLNPGLSCGVCEFCRRGEQSECESFAIMGASRPGAFAEYVAAPAVNWLPKPAHLSFEEAAALPLAHVTAWRMLMTRAALRPGETVLIHGIGGGVALAALQLSKLTGAQVIVTSSSQEKLDRACQMGADHAINYKEQDVVAVVGEFTHGRGADVIVDTVGAATWPLDLGAARRGGRIVLCGVTTGAEAPANLRTIYWNQLQVFGSVLGSHEDFRLMLRAVEATEMKPVISCVEPLDRAREAMTLMEQGAQFGKIVLRV